MKKIYLAGPQVFKDNPSEFESFAIEFCKKNNLEAFFPIDNNLTNSKDIYKNNINLIKNADIVVACMDEFRGISLDVGTSFEMGYAKALNKKIYGYKKNKESEYKNRAKSDNEYPKIEDFGLTDNLMVVHTCDKIFSSFEEVIKHINKIELNKKLKY